MIPVTCVPTSTDVTDSIVPVAVTISDIVMGLTVKVSSSTEVLSPQDESAPKIAIDRGAAIMYVVSFIREMNMRE